MNGIEHIISPVNAPWCSWTMFGLMLCAILSEVLQPGVLTQVATILFSRTERTYKAAPDNILGQLFITLFRIGVPALLLTMAFYTGGDFLFISFALVFGVIFAIVLVKMGCNILLDYTFQFSRHYSSAYEQYGAIVTLTCVLLYPLLLLVIYLGSAIIARWISGIGILVFFGLILFRWCRTYLHSFTSLGYIVLYILTLEVVPMATLLWISYTFLI